MVLSGDLGYSVFEPLIEKFPNQFINVGIAEQNMIGISAGLALSGKKVFVYSITPFSTIRPLEQIRMDVCYHNLPVRIVGTGAGLSYGTLGPSHHGTEDLAIMRAMPTMIVTAPADRFELEKILDAAMNISSPMYIRIGRSTEPDVYSVLPALELGKANVIYDEGDDFAIIACGNMVHTALCAAKKLQALSKKGKVISMHTIKPLDCDLVVTLAKTMPTFTLEEHSIIGGLGSAVAECIADNCISPPYFERFALKDAFQKKIGKHDYLRDINDLTVDKIVDKILKRI